MSRELRAAMRRHPAGKRLTSHTGATVLPFCPVSSTPTRQTVVETVSEKGQEND